MELTIKGKVIEHIIAVHMSVYAGDGIPGDTSPDRCHKGNCRCSNFVVYDDFDTPDPSDTEGFTRRILYFDHCDLENIKLL